MNSKRPMYPKTPVRFFVFIVIASLFSYQNLLFGGFLGSAMAAVPKVINYQGRLEDSSGNLLGGSAGTNFDFKFSIWDASSTATGTRVWPNPAPASTTHKVTNGVFDARLGDVSQGFATLDFDFNTSTIIYLEIAVLNTSTALFEILSPRQPIVSTGFAINAGTLNGFTQGTSSNNILLLNASGSINLPGGQIRTINSASCSGLTALGGGSLCYDTGNNNLFVFNNASSSWVALGGSSSTGGTLQQAYDLGNTITATSSRDISFTLSDTAVDPNFIVNIAASSTSSFKIQYNSADRLFINSSTIVLSSPTTVSSTLTVTGVSSLQAFTFTNATGSGNLQTATFTATGQSSLQSVSSTNFAANNVSSSNVSSTNITATGNVAAGTLSVTGQSTLTSVSSTNLLATGYLQSTLSGLAFLLTGTPPSSTSSQLFQFGPNTIQGSNTTGTYLGANIASGFNGNFIDLQVNSSTRFLVTGAGVVSSTELRTPSGTIATLYDSQGNKYSTSTGSGNITINQITTSTFSFLASGVGLSVASSAPNVITYTIASSSYLQPSNNFSELTNTSTARTNIGLGNVANSLQLIASNNLSDLVSTSSARTNIGFSAGTGISLSALGVFANVGVTSVTGTVNQVVVSNTTGTVTLSLPQSINTGASVVFANVSSTSITFTNATGSGNFQVATFYATIAASTTGLTFTNATGSGNLQAATIVTTGQASLNSALITNTLTADIINATTSFRTNGVERISSTGTAVFANLTASGQTTLASATSSNLEATGTLKVSGQSNFQSVSSTNLLATGYLQSTLSAATALLLTGGIPPVSTSSSLFQLGFNNIQNSNTTGTFIGSNPSSTFVGNFIDLQVNSSTQFRVSATGTLTLAGNLSVATIFATTVSSTGITFTNATSSGSLALTGAGTALTVTNTGVFGTVSSTGITFTNATGSGNLQIGSLSVTNAGTFGTVSSTGITFTNATGSGNFQAGTIIATTLTSSTGITFTNATGSGNIGISTLSVTGAGTALTVTNAGTFGTVSSTGITFTNATGSGNLQTATFRATGNSTFDGRMAVGTTTFTGSISIQSSTDAATGIAGIFEQLLINPTTGGNFQFGDRMIVTVSSTASTTAIGSFIRMIDSTSLANTVQALQVQAWSGTNAQGENTGISTAGRTFGIKAFTSGEAGGVAQPAAVYAELQNGTQGNALRAYSSTSTTATLVSLFQETSAFSGNGILMNFGNSGGSFTGNFLSLQRASTTVLMVNATGTVVIGSSTLALATSTTMLLVCAQSNCTLPTTVTSSVAFFASTDGTAGTNSIVAKGTVQGGLADIAEYVAVTGKSGDYETGDLLSISSSSAVRFEKSSTSYDSMLAGIVTPSAAFVAGGEVQVGEARVIMSLAGRVPLKVNTTNGSIKIGDFLTGSGVPGEAMKAGRPGRVVGMALEPFDGSTGLVTSGANASSGKIIVLVNPHWYVPEVTADSLQGGTIGTGSALNTYTFDPKMIYSFENLKVQHLEIGSTEKPSGITIYDVVTKNPYCIVSENGVLKSLPGKCGSTMLTAGGDGATTNIISTSTATDSVNPTAIISNSFQETAVSAPAAEPPPPIVESPATSATSTTTLPIVIVTSSTPSETVSDSSSTTLTPTVETTSSITTNAASSTEISPSLPPSSEPLPAISLDMTAPAGTSTVATTTDAQAPPN